MRSRLLALTTICAGAAAFVAMSPFTSASPMLPAPMKPSFLSVTMPRVYLESRRDASRPKTLHPRHGRRRRAGVAARQGAVDGECPAARDQERDAEADRQQMVLEPFALLSASPVHEEADLAVDQQDRGDHQASNSDRCQAG